MKNNENWAICSHPPFDMLQSLVTYEMIDDENIIVRHYDKSYHMKLEQIKPIDTPKYVWGDKASPANHPELLGEVISMGYHFKNKDMMYYLSINGKMKSKRYFAADLIGRD